ncbi:MAG TPA: tetratricopeptide repeat protein, partial [Bacteroidia bacterium]|nr:tetratricopeptide repeat protein [Bacteroidia bacterium]
TGAIKEISAYSYRNLGDIKTALPLFEELYKTTNSVENGYQVATMQFTMKRFGECFETITKIKTNPESKTAKVVITTEQGDNMRVTYLAAVENLSGVLYTEMGKPEMAKAAYERAIAEAPDFILAKKNLENMQAKPVIK